MNEVKLFGISGPIRAPGNVSILNITQYSAVIIWSPVSEEDLCGFLLGYYIYYWNTEDINETCEYIIHHNKIRFRFVQIIYLFSLVVFFLHMNNVLKRLTPVSSINSIQNYKKPDLNYSKKYIPVALSVLLSNCFSVLLWVSVL